MEDSKNEMRIIPPELVVKMTAIALGALALFLLVLTASSLKGYRFIGTGVAAANTIVVSGEGEVVAVPDTAEFTYTVDETGVDVSTAQTKATKKSNDILSYLKQEGIDEKDIQTTSYNINPQYSYQQVACPAVAGGTAAIYCPPGRQTITGYEVSQSVAVKVRDTSKAGGILAGIGNKGASNVSGLTFTASNEKDLEAQAREKAISDARAQAQKLASSLGVSIVRIVGFNENGSYPTPMYVKAVALDSAAGSAAAPEIATGQNTIKSDVSVTFEIE